MVLYPSGDEELDLIYRLYLEAFPSVERQPYKRLLEFREQGRAGFYTIKSGGFAGFIITLEYNDLALINYFATAPEIRGSGIGKQAIEALCAELEDKEKRVFLEIEEVPDDAMPDDMKLRRKTFYKRCGFEPSGIYARVFSCDFELMTYNSRVSAREYVELMHSFFGDRVTKNIKFK